MGKTIFYIKSRGIVYTKSAAASARRRGDFATAQRKTLKTHARRRATKRISRRSIPTLI
ncbi:hypothetical protein ENTCAN_07144 [Enterobacter cancerogenus ATCC 35316]|nr:hypothetical protein ENTCAN_07144 [Enterobacter cancerogenus ATCC 35316]